MAEILTLVTETEKPKTPTLGGIGLVMWYHDTIASLLVAAEPINYTNTPDENPWNPSEVDHSSAYDEYKSKKIYPQVINDARAANLPKHNRIGHFIAVGAVAGD